MSHAIGSYSLMSELTLVTKTKTLVNIDNDIKLNCHIFCVVMLLTLFQVL